MLCDTLVVVLASFTLNCGGQSWPIAIGKDNTPSPTGKFEIESLHVNPMPKVFGSRAICFNGYYCIHGTNEPALIGTKASLGCIRMHNEHIEALFEQISSSTEIRICQTAANC